MFIKTILVLCGISGACVAIGVPVSIQESKQLRDLWGEDWAFATQVTSLLGGAQRGDNKTIDNTVRVFICKELGAKDTSYVNNDVEGGVSTWQYSCHKNGENGKILSFSEEPQSKYYEWKSVSNNFNVKLRCLRTISKLENNTEVDWSKCKKK